jgi:hypothetical protein
MRVQGINMCDGDASNLGSADLYPVEVLMRTRYMMEFMALVADPFHFNYFDPDDRKKKKVHPPSPGGVPMAITLMPDFVIDLHADLISHRPEGAQREHQLRPIDVGGRVGRIASLLHAFGGARNGWYQINYVTKIGRLGRVILEERFRRNSLDSMSLRFAFPNGTDWIAIYNHISQTSTGSNPAAESYRPGLELSSKDVDDSSFGLEDVFSDSRYLVVASKSEKHARAALILAQNGLTKIYEKRYVFYKKGTLPIGILLDLTAVDSKDNIENLLKTFQEVCASLSGSYHVSPTLLVPESFIKADDFHIPDCIYLRRGERRLEALVPGSQPVCVDLSIAANLSSRMIRDALTSGYVLASACHLGWELLRLWSKAKEISAPPFPEFNHWIIPRLHSGPDSVDLRQRLEFAASWANAVDKVNARWAPSYYDIFRLTMPNRETGHVPSDPVDEELEVAETLQELAEENRRRGKDKPFLSTDRATLLAATLTDRARQSQQTSTFFHPAFQSGRHAATKRFQVPSDAINGFISMCERRDLFRALEQSKESVKKIVMLDLDSTLLDPSGLRKVCWINALRVFFAAAQRKYSRDELESAYNIYATFVYDNHEKLGDLLHDSHATGDETESCNFRHVWNHRYAWAILLWLLDLGSPKDFSSGWDPKNWALIFTQHKLHNEENQRLKDAGLPEQPCPCMGCDLLRGHGDLGRPREGVLPTISHAGSPTSPNVAIVAPFLERLGVFAAPLRLAREAFWNVEYSCYPQARTFVEALRSDPTCEVYVVTEGDEETQLKKIRVVGLDDLIPTGKVLSTGAASSPHEVRRELETLRARLSVKKEMFNTWFPSSGASNVASKEIDDCLDAVNFFKRLLELLEAKTNQAFYSAVLGAIRLNPASPADLLHSWQELRALALSRREDSKPMKFFMVGDRYDNDLSPILKLLGTGTSDSPAKVGTIRLISGKNSKKEVPPKDLANVRSPITMYKCETLMQCLHILSSDKAWDNVKELPDPIPPVLLTPKFSDDVEKIFCGDTDDAVPLAGKIEYLAWASVHEDFRHKTGLSEVIRQVCRDVAVCPKDSVFDLFQSLATDVQKLWEAPAVSAAVAGKKYRGMLSILDWINRSRLTFASPWPHTESGNPEKLSWCLGQHLLSVLSIPVINLDQPQSLAWRLKFAGPAHFEVECQKIIAAIPYCLTGYTIVGAVNGLPLCVGSQDWLENYLKLI